MSQIGRHTSSPHSHDAMLEARARADLGAILDAGLDGGLFTIAAVRRLREAFLRGRIDGQTYLGSCACVKGTLAQLGGYDIARLPAGSPCALPLDELTGSPLERFIIAVAPAHTPATNVAAARVVAWLDAYLAQSVEIDHEATTRGVSAVAA